MAPQQQNNGTTKSSRLSFILGGIALAWFVNRNRFLFGLPCPPPDPDFTVLTEHEELDKWLQVYKEDLGDDYQPYRHHCLRVLSYANYWLSLEKENHSLFADSKELLGVSVAHHDIALWANGELNYLAPSAADMDRADHNLTAAELQVADEIIMQHHKYTEWKGGKSHTDELLVNAIRKSDWADFTFGVVRYGLPLGNVCKAYQVLPDIGFHMILAGMGARLSPDSFVGRFAVLKILRW